MIRPYQDVGQSVNSIKHTEGQRITLRGRKHIYLCDRRRYLRGGGGGGGGGEIGIKG